MRMWLYPRKACPHHPPLLTVESSSTQSYLQNYITTLSSHHHERWRQWEHSNVDTRCSKHVHDLITYSNARSTESQAIMSTPLTATEIKFSLMPANTLGRQATSIAIQRKQSLIKGSPLKIGEQRPPITPTFYKNKILCK
jgi:hypothetical protein